MSDVPKKVDLDVRPLLRNKQEPFQVIMQTVNDLNNAGDTLVLHATFKPEPLLGVMQKKGFRNTVEEIDSEHWIVTFVRESEAGS